MSQEEQIPALHSIEIGQFLKTPAGQSLITELARRRPALGLASTIEAQALTSREAKGWEDCIKEIFAISNERPVESPVSGGHMDMSDGETQKKE
jgi:hypothetical protein